MGQGQLRVTFYITIVVLQSMMLHTKFQANWPSGSGAKDFIRFWAFLNMAASLVLWLWTFGYHGQPRVMINTNFVELQNLMLHTKFQGNWPSGWEKKIFLWFWVFFSMTAILVMWPWPFDYHYFFHPTLASYKIYFHLALLFLKKIIYKFLSKFSTQMTLAKVTKCPWPVTFISDWCDFISIPTCREKWASAWENQQFAYAKTKTQISFAVSAKLISAFVFATWIYI